MIYRLTRSAHHCARAKFAVVTATVLGAEGVSRAMNCAQLWVPEPWFQVFAWGNGQEVQASSKPKTGQAKSDVDVGKSLF